MSMIFQAVMYTTEGSRFTSNEARRCADVYRGMVKELTEGGETGIEEANQFRANVDRLVQDGQIDRYNFNRVAAYI